MIPAKRPLAQPPRWQQLWREAIVDPRELLEVVGLGHLAASRLPAADTGFGLRVPRGFVARMRKGDADDPLLRQVLPDVAELDVVAGYTRDAVGDLAARAAPGVLHKYAGRALVVATGACAVHCRYCFRRHFPYADEASGGRWDEALAYLARDSTIEEAILSGGDPLSLATPKLGAFTQALRSIPHVRRLRLHTRVPVVLPERVDAEFVDWLAGVSLQKVIVLHVNHAREIDAAVAAACADLRAAGATLLNQAVLLRGVNDDVDALQALSERLFDVGVLPYYLHQLDRVAGAAHFDVGDAQARTLVAALGDRVPGYLVPRLVREIAGAPAKQPLAPGLPPGH